MRRGLRGVGTGTNDVTGTPGCSVAQLVAMLGGGGAVVADGLHSEATVAEQEPGGVTAGIASQVAADETVAKGFDR